jgi:hypothetical protein
MEMCSYKLNAYMSFSPTDVGSSQCDKLQLVIRHHRKARGLGETGTVPSSIVSIL